MRIAYLIPEFPGQTHMFFWRERQVLERLGFEVELFSTRPPAKAIVCHAWSEAAIARTRYLTPMGPGRLAATLAELLRVGPGCWWRCAAAVVRCRDASLMQRLKMAALIPPAAYLRRLLRQRGVEHLHVHSCASGALVAVFARLMGGPTYSLTLHGALPTYGPGQSLKWTHARFGMAVTQRLKRDLCERVPSLDADKVHVAPMGVDLAVFQRRKPYAPPTRSDCRIVSCGRLHPGKGHQELIEAIALLRKCGHGATLTILGEGPARPMLEQRVVQAGLQDVVTLAGAVDEQHVRDALEQAHLFALGSHDEAIGVATMEAMAMALPVVVTDVGGVRELVRDGVDGLLVVPLDPRAMADGIEKLIDAPATAQTMGEAGRQRVAAHFSSERSAGIIAKELEGKRHAPAEPALAGGLGREMADV